MQGLGVVSPPGHEHALLSTGTARAGSTVPTGTVPAGALQVPLLDHPDLRASAAAGCDLPEVAQPRGGEPGLQRCR
jgi:hypothetical protein